MITTAPIQPTPEKPIDQMTATEAAREFAEQADCGNWLKAMEALFHFSTEAVDDDDDLYSIVNGFLHLNREMVRRDREIAELKSQFRHLATLATSYGRED